MSDSNAFPWKMSEVTVNKYLAEENQRLIDAWDRIETAKQLAKYGVEI